MILHKINIGPKLASKIDKSDKNNFPIYFHKSLFLSPAHKYEILKIVKARKSIVDQPE